MDVRFLSPDLAHLDSLRCEAIISSFCSDERPLSGTLGLIDWRLCGFLSRSIVRGHLRGEAGATALLPLRPRLTVDKLFLVGLGASAALDRAASLRLTRQMLALAERARVRTLAIVLPGRSTALAEPQPAMEAFVEAIAAGEHHDEIILLEPPSAQKLMEPIVQRERRKARAAGAG